MFESGGTMLRALSVSALALALIGCGGGSGVGKPVAVFPSKADVEEVMIKDAKVEAPMTTVDVPNWRLTTKVPGPGSTYPTEAPWDRYLAGRFGDGKAKLSPELC